MLKIHKGDNVQVIRGKDAGKTGTVDKVFAKEGKVLVQGVNQYKRHVKARTQGQTSEIVTLSRPLAMANVEVVCPKCKKGVRIGIEVGKDGKKARVCKSCGGKI